MRNLEKKLSIIVFSGSVDKLMLAAIIGSAAAQMGIKVTMFFTFWGIVASRKDFVEKNDKISPEFNEFKQPMMEAMMKNNVKPWFKLLEEAKETGNLTIYACGMSMDLLGIKKEDLIDIFDDVVGVGTFLMESEDGQVLFI